MQKAVSIKSVNDSKLSRLVNIKENKEKNHKPTPQNNQPTTDKEINRKEKHRQKVRKVLGYKREDSFLGHQNQSPDIESIHIIYLLDKSYPLSCYTSTLPGCSSFLYITVFYSVLL